MGFLGTVSVILLVVIIGYILYKLFFAFKRKRSAEWIEQDKLQETMRSAQVIDVREKTDFDRGHILGARNIPYTMARAHKEYLLAIRKDTPIYLYDNRNTMAIYMAGLLKKEGYTNIHILKGGYMNWTGKTKTK